VDKQDGEPDGFTLRWWHVAIIVAVLRLLIEALTGPGG
jgi:hypothetical protein